MNSITNPKEKFGDNKVPMSCVPAPVLMEVGLAMLEGATKYGRHNYRESSVIGSTYYDATMRHLMDWWEGQDIDHDSGMSHITKAIASLVVLRDTMIQGTFIDNRPPRSPCGWLEEMNTKVSRVKLIQPISGSNEHMEMPLFNHYGVDPTSAQG